METKPDKEAFYVTFESLTDKLQVFFKDSMSK